MRTSTPSRARNAATASDTSSSSREIEARPDLHDRDRAAEATIHLAKLEPDVAAAQHQEMPRQVVDLQHRAVGEIVDLVETRDVGHRGAAADIDEDLVGTQDVGPDLDLVRRQETRVALVDGAFSSVLSDRSTPLLERPATWSLRALTRFMSTVTPPPPDGEAVVGAAPRRVRGIGAGDQRLGRRAPRIDAGAAEAATLDDRHFHARSRQPPREGRSRLAGADDDGVVVGHAVLLRGCSRQVGA